MTRLFRLLPLALLAACGSERVAGNNGTSTDNVITVALSIDSAAFGQERPDTGAYPLLLKLSASRIDFDRTLPNGGDLRVQLDDSSALPFQIREWNRDEGIGSLWVRIPRSALWKSRDLLLSHGGGIRYGLSDPVATWNGVSAALTSRLKSVLLADFEQDTLRALLPCGCNPWYPGGELGVTWLTPAFGAPMESSLRLDTLGPRSKVLHLAWSQSAPGQWMLAGTRLGTRMQRFTLLDSITFRARGNSKLQIALEDGRDTSDRSKAWATVQLGPNWKNYTIRPSDFDPEGPYNLAWESVRTRVNTFTVFGKDGSALWIDDIRLHGIGAAELQ
jgi:hypothetical protein